MKTMSVKKLAALILICVICLQSCTQDLNFNQTNLSATPSYNVPLIFFKLNQSNFFDQVNGVNISQITDISDFTTLQTSVIRDNLLKADFLFEISNQFNQSFTVDVIFLDNNNNETYRFDQMVIPSQSQNLTIEQTIMVANNQSFLNSRKTQVIVNLQNSGSSIDPNLPNAFELKLSGIFYFSF